MNNSSQTFGLFYRFADDYDLMQTELLFTGSYEQVQSKLQEYRSHTQAIYIQHYEGSSFEEDYVVEPLGTKEVAMWVITATVNAFLNEDSELEFQLVQQNMVPIRPRLLSEQTAMLQLKTVERAKVPDITHGLECASTLFIAEGATPELARARFISNMNAFVENARGSYNKEQALKTRAHQREIQRELDAIERARSKPWENGGNYDELPRKWDNNTGQNA